MSIPLYCSECGDFIGAREPDSNLFLAGDLSQISSIIHMSCPGRGNHFKPIETTKIKFLNLIREVCRYYPDTQTSSSWFEYCGPPYIFCLLIASLGTRTTGGGLLVDHSWAWRDVFHCHGEGWEKVRKEYRDNYYIGEE